jgi:hypothetical protein
MPLFVDARVPVRFGSVSDAAHGSALLIEGDTPAPDGVAVARFADTAAPPGPHPPGCPCCTARSPVAVALAALFLARARGEVDFFPTVVAVCCTPEGEAAVRAALECDPLVIAWFRSIA